MKGLDTARSVSAPAKAATEPERAPGLAFGGTAERATNPPAGDGASRWAALAPAFEERPRANRPTYASRPQRGRYGAYGRRDRGPFYAALDLGTNNCRLLIAEPHGDSFRIVDSFSRIVRLGEGLSTTGTLRPEAMDRAFAALRICAEKLQDRPVARARLIATEACRQAANGAEFLARVRDELGIELEIIDRRT